LSAKHLIKRDRDGRWIGGLVGVEADPIGARRMEMDNPRPVERFFFMKNLPGIISGFELTIVNHINDNV
jgi:hypothetical protein